MRDMHPYPSAAPLESSMGMLVFFGDLKLMVACSIIK